MAVAENWLGETALQRLYRSFTKDRLEIEAILDAARARGVTLNGGCNRLTQARSARIASISAEHLLLQTRHFGEAPLPQVPLSFSLHGRRWFFVAIPQEWMPTGLMLARIPSVLYEPERRDLMRSAPALVDRAPRAVELRDAEGKCWSGRVTDWSYHGMGVEIRQSGPTGEQVEISSGEIPGSAPQRAVIRHRSLGERPGWIRLGLEIGVAEQRSRVRLDRRSTLPPLEVGRSSRPSLSWRARKLVSRVARPFARHGSASAVPIVEFRNSRGERIRAILDRIGHQAGAPLILIPPAWGRTKETVAPLALTLLETFRALGRPIAVLRFDGTRRRGESFNDPQCLQPGNEYRHFTFSGAVDDIHAALAFSRTDPSLRPSSILVVSSSLASIEARRAIARSNDPRIAGWVSLVGLVDLHTVLRAVSGGIDYGLGALRGVKFGEQDLFGVRCDIDRLVSDAINNRLWFLQDARQDLASIRLPVTWIHGRHDAWANLENVRDALSCGNSSERRLIELPIGHQIRSSLEAEGVFRLVASEVGRILTGRPVRAISPTTNRIQRRERIERRRLPLPHFDVRQFWRDYLVGRSGKLGMELLTASSSYGGLIAAEVNELDLKHGERVADLGSGVGDLSVFLRADRATPANLRVDSFDYVPEALLRQRARLAKGDEESPRVRLVLADLAVNAGLSLPLRNASYNAVLASLVLTYLPDPDRFLAELFRVLKPGGRLVVSGIRPDTDVSKLYVDSLEELPPDRLAELFGDDIAASAAELRRTFLSDASRIIDLEEFGYFRFWDRSTLVRMVRGAGFSEISVVEVFGDPPQALVVGGRRPK